METSRPPVFGKEVFMKTTRIPVSIQLLLCLASLFLIPTDMYGMELKINGIAVPLLADTMAAAARPRPVAGTIRNSLVLEELLPVFRQLESLSISDSSGKRVSPETGIETGEESLVLYRSFIIPDGSKYDFALVDTDGALLSYIPDITEISITGEAVESGELEVWLSWEGVRELKREIERWGRLHNIEVRVNEVPKSDSKLLSVLRGGGAPPDVILVQSDYLPALTAAKALQPMVRFPLEGFSGKSLESFSLDSQLWAVPFYFDTQLLFYRKDLVTLRTLSGPGWNLNSFEAELRRLLEQGISPASWNAYSAYWLAPFQIGFGKESLLEADGSVVVNDDASRAAVGYLKSLSDEGLLDLRERDNMFSRFVSGDVAIMLSSSFSIPELQRAGVPFGVAPFPRGPRGAVAPFLDFKGFAISRKTKNPLLARRFLLSMSDPALQHDFTSRLHKLPAVEAAWELSEQSNPFFPVLRESYDSGITVPSLQGYKIYKNTMWKMLRFMLTGKIPVREGLEQAQQLIDNQMKR